MITKCANFPQLLHAPYQAECRAFLEQDNVSSYTKWLQTILSNYLSSIDLSESESALSEFLLDLPAVPEETMGLLRTLCERSAR